MTMGTMFALFFHILPISIAKSLYFSIFSSSFFTTLVSPSNATSMILHSSIILSIRIKSGLLASIVLSVYTLKSHNSLTCLFSITGSTLWSYHFSLWGRPYFLHWAQCIVVLFIIITLMTIDVQSSQTPCGTSSSTQSSSFSAAGVLSLSVDVLRLHCMFSCKDVRSSCH